MKLIYVCSPLRGDYEANRERAIGYCRYVASLGHVPIAPHVYFTTFLDDNDPDQREHGMEMGLDMVPMCDELWVFPDDVSEGMLNEMELAKSECVPITYINSRDIPRKVQYFESTKNPHSSGYYCPKCERMLLSCYEQDARYCARCGQKLDWEEVEET